MSRRQSEPTIRISSSRTAMRAPRKRLAELMKFVAEREGTRLAEVDLAVVGNDEIASLNRGYLRHAGPTDVLSFDLSDSSACGICVQLVVCGMLQWNKPAPAA